MFSRSAQASNLTWILAEENVAGKYTPLNQECKNSKSHSHITILYIFFLFGIEGKKFVLLFSFLHCHSARSPAHQDFTRTRKTALLPFPLSPKSDRKRSSYKTSTFHRNGRLIGRILSDFIAACLTGKGLGQPRRLRLTSWKPI